MWIEIKDAKDIKKVPVGGMLRINSVVTLLTNHHDVGDFGFDICTAIQMYGDRYSKVVSHRAITDGEVTVYRHGVRFTYDPDGVSYDL